MKHKPKSSKGLPLHQFIATGGKPSQFEGCKGVSSETVPGYKKGRK
jgi:hypothetical protein